MLGSSEMQEITEKKVENEVGKSLKIERVILERENGEKMVEENGERGANNNNNSNSNSNSNNSNNNNRWPQQETMALLRIRSEMDVTFKEAGPGCKTLLWDDVSRKMNELGYQRSAKKCKEKFENIYKYHKRVKSCSYSQTNRKAYRFFDQLEALGHHQFSFPSSSEPVNTSINDSPFVATPISSHPQYLPQMSMPTAMNLYSLNLSTSTASTSGSESEGIQTKKRKWANFFEILEKSVLEKQEALQNKFLEAIDKSERERQARDEAWKLQEMERIKREQELLMQERSISAAKDAAILSFLQKISEQGNFSEASGPVLDNLTQEMSVIYRTEKENGENSSSRWPKEEVETLIKIKTNMEIEYQKIGPKGPMWEEISVAMKNAGYDRNAKRCKEKWENINKYYRRVKDSNKPRHVDSKTCPYFHLLDTLYNMKTKRFENSSENSGSNLSPEELLLHMMNHHNSKQQQQGQVVLQQEDELLMQNSKLSQNKEAVDKEGAGSFQVVAQDPLSIDTGE